MNAIEGPADAAVDPPPPGGQPVRPGEQYARLELMDLINDARQVAHRAYDTGDRIQSGVCINHHLSPANVGELLIADTFLCPTCGHVLKRRR